MNQKLLVHIVKDSDSLILEVQGASQIDVPPLSTKKYLLKIYGYQKVRKPNIFYLFKKIALEFTEFRRIF